MGTAVVISVVVAIVLMLLIGGRAERRNLRGLTRPWQPRYRDDLEPPRNGD
jgi:hypothetical protein